jgi:hypothetical protein
LAKLPRDKTCLQDNTSTRCLPELSFDPAR